jgi:asparagine synthase (glutamine-hydrolysing)
VLLGTAGAQERAHWEPRYAEPIRDPARAATELRAMLEHVVARSADPDAALLLSGGLDSTAVAALSPPPGPLALHAGFPGTPEVDETAIVDRTVEQLGLRLLRAEVRDVDALGFAADYTSRWAVPLATPNEAVWASLAGRAAEQGATVILDGEGGDSVLGPAPLVVADYVRAGRLLGARRASARLVGERLALRGLWRFGLLGALPAGAHQALRRLRGPGHHAPPWLRPAAAAALLEVEQPWAFKRADAPRWWAQRVHELVDLLDASGAHDLPRRRAAAVGMTSRHPLQHPDLVELVLRLDPELSHDAGRDRPLARDALIGLVPEHVRTRTAKPYFNAVQEQWLLADRAGASALLGPDALIGEHVDLPAVRRWALGAPAAHPHGRLRWPLDTWRVLAMEIWLRHQSGGKCASSWRTTR